MKLDEALRLYKIPYMITQTITGDGFISYKLTPAGSSATPQRLKTLLPALQTATGQHLEIVNDTTALYIRALTKQPLYDYKDYNGYIDFNNPDIPFIVGFSGGQIVLDTIDNARHILIAGTTGSGKSVFLHNLITTILCNKHNYTYLVDCKKVELSMYKEHAQVATSVFGEGQAAVIIDGLIDRMEARFDDMEQRGVNDFKQYKRIIPDARRHILVVDELSDLIENKKARARVIPELLRIAQKGRAAGFHVILATQRPDASVINGTLKGNLPTRIAFRTISNMDSRIILDQSGAELLRGNGDGLYLRNGSFNLQRVQCPHIDPAYIRRIMTA